MSLELKPMESTIRDAHEHVSPRTKVIHCMCSTPEKLKDEEMLAGYLI